MKILLLISVILCTAATSEGCHGKPVQVTDVDENKDFSGIFKRSVRPSAADARKDLSDFFTECMIRKGRPGVIPKMRAVIDFVLRDLIWYEAVDESLCSGDKDTRACWNNEAGGLIESELLGPLRECLLEYATGNRTGGYRQKRQSEDGWPNFEPRTPLQPDQPCPGVPDEMYATCIAEELNSTTDFPSLKNFHWESIAIFLRYHYSRCRYERVERTGESVSYRKTCPPYRFKTTSGGPAQVASQQCVPFILQEVIKDESPLNVPSEECNARFQNVTIIVEETESLNENFLTPEEELRQFGHRGRHNGADIIGYCDPKSPPSVWFDNVTNNGIGDSELLTDIRRSHPDVNICSQPSGIQIRVSKNEEPWYTSGNNLNVMSPNQGLQCSNSMQHNKPCENFKVRFCCVVNAQSSSTKPPYRKTASTVGTCGPRDKWGYWRNIDSSPRNGGDFESFQRYGMPSCISVAVQGRIRGSNRPYTQAHNNLSAEDPKLGIICRDNIQPKERPCRDFEVRFCCKDGNGIVTTTVSTATTAPTVPSVVIR